MSDYDERVTVMDHGPELNYLMNAYVAGPAVKGRGP